ncbi:MAG TPA: YqhA family protein [Thermoflexales bacterium]|jgi:uncharacterized membrane protein YqhA|nr:YqhA family protein [Anaerolineae bacterium]HQV29516.1 YqhA family protein [Thermoflexales bacterium]HQX10688.1 YqhA family protein [Thermoflexales bacterium]HQY25576.1 YqhA family protein [Thermoflexales bacterium]HQZ54706.1 YqhA family protein [Thermoflexales bacterium]
MKRILESSRYVVLIAVISMLVAAIATFLWGAFHTVVLVGKLIASPSDAGLIVPIVQLMDLFLLGTVLLVFALGLYELFIQKLALPEWLIIDDLKKLKGKLSDVVILIIGIKFLEKLIESKNAQDTLMNGIAGAVVIGALVLFNFASTKGAE